MDNKIERKTFIDFTDVQKELAEKADVKKEQKLFKQADGKKFVPEIAEQITKSPGENGGKLNITDLDIENVTTKAVGEEGGDFEVVTRSPGENGGKPELDAITTDRHTEFGGPDLDMVTTDKHSEFGGPDLDQPVAIPDDVVVSDRTQEGGESPNLPDDTIVTDRHSEFGGPDLETVVSDKHSEFGGNDLDFSVITKSPNENGEKPTVNPDFNVKPLNIPEGNESIAWINNPNIIVNTVIDPNTGEEVQVSIQNPEIRQVTFDNMKNDIEYRNEIQEQLDATRNLIKKMREKRTEE